jgi:hypothetical protein
MQTAEWNPAVNPLLFVYAFTPALRRIAIIGHQLVNADWNKFKPTKAVNKYQYGLTQ